MGRALRTMTMYDGTVVEERGCDKYVCRFCGGKAVACNYVADMCLQVAARHAQICGAFVNDEKYCGYVTECSTCVHYDEGSNTCELQAVPIEEFIVNQL